VANAVANSGSENLVVVAETGGPFLKPWFQFILLGLTVIMLIATNN